MNTRAKEYLDPSTIVSTSHGTFEGIPYTRYEAMFSGVTSNNRPYRVPCQIIAPTNPSQGSGMLLFDWLVQSTAFTALGQEQALARALLGDQVIFGRGLAYATVRCDSFCIGKSSPFPDPSLPWSDGLLDISTESITSAGDEFDIVIAFNNALRSDPFALQVLGPISRRLAFSYSAGGTRLRAILRSQRGEGLFDFSLIGGTGIGYSLPTGNDSGFSHAEKAPLPGAGLEIDVQSETDVLNGAYKSRHELPNLRTYQVAGAAHIRDVDAAAFGLRDPELANPAEWTPFLRGLFVAGIKWCDGIIPPPTLWLGAPNDLSIARDAKGNALVSYVGGVPVATNDFRLPEVAVGENQYIPLDSSYDDGTFLGMFRSIGGGRVDLKNTFTNHGAYVAEVTYHARKLQTDGYLLADDADKIIQRAIDSSIGKP